MSEFDRIINIYADSTLICEDLRKRVNGKSTMTLYPDVWQVDLYNPSETDMALMQKCEKITVSAGDNDDALVSSKVTDIIQRVDNGLHITTLFFMPGESFWRSFSSTSILSGVTVKQAMSTILGQAGVSADNVPDIGKKILRGIAVFGRTADAVTDLAKSYNLKVWTFGDEFYATEKEKGETAITILASDVIGSPETMQNTVIVNTLVRSAPVGRMAETPYGTMRIVAEQISADTYSGDWYTSITLADETSMTMQEWEGMA